MQPTGLFIDRCPWRGLRMTPDPSGIGIRIAEGEPDECGLALAPSPGESLNLDKLKAGSKIRCQQPCTRFVP